jgi:type IV secretory pathway TraG/TraD family ATPase VirD4
MFFLGKSVSREPVFSSDRSHLLVLGPPRSGKTSSLVIPNVKIFPGPVVVTSTKDDVFEAVLLERSKRGQVLLFDPSGLVDERGAVRIKWSPVDASSSFGEAVLLVESFVDVALGEARGAERHWNDRAKALLAPAVFAAHLIGASMSAVSEWIDSKNLDWLVQLLEESGDTKAATVLKSVLETEVRERSAILSTASAALAAYRFDGGLESGEIFNVDSFLAGEDTLVIVSPSLTQKVVAPLVVALIENLTRACYLAHLGGNRVKVALVLDEMANIAPLPSLGSLLSEGLSQGVHLLGALQDLSQAALRWPELERGMFTLFGTTVVLGGIGDPRTLSLLEALVGQRESIDVSWQEGLGRFGSSRSFNPRKVPSISTHDLRSLPNNRAAVIDLRGEIGIVELVPDYL